MALLFWFLFIYILIIPFYSIIFSYFYHIYYVNYDLKHIFVIKKWCSHKTLYYIGYFLNYAQFFGGTNSQQISYIYLLLIFSAYLPQPFPFFYLHWNVKVTSVHVHRILFIWCRIYRHFIILYKFDIFFSFIMIWHNKF